MSRASHFVSPCFYNIYCFIYISDLSHFHNTAIFSVSILLYLSRKTFSVRIYLCARSIYRFIVFALRLMLPRRILYIVSWAIVDYSRINLLCSHKLSPENAIFVYDGVILTVYNNGNSFGFERRVLLFDTFFPRVFLRPTYLIVFTLLSMFTPLLPLQFSSYIVFSTRDCNRRDTRFGRHTRKQRWHFVTSLTNFSFDTRLTATLVPALTHCP